MLIGSDINNLEDPKSNQVDDSQMMKEEGELEDGELDDEVDEIPAQPDPAVTKESSPGVGEGQSVESAAVVTAKSEKRRERNEERKQRSRGDHHSGSRSSTYEDSKRDDEDGDGHGRSQHHAKRREKHRSKDDSEKKKSNYSTYVDFDDLHDDFDTEDSWMQSKKLRQSRESLRGPYDSPNGSGEEFEDDELMHTSSRSYRSYYRAYSGSYDDLGADEEDDENEATEHASDLGESRGQYNRHTSQEGGGRGSPGRFFHSSSPDRKVRSQLPRKRKLIDTPMEERPACKFFKEGKCVKGSECPFNHDFVPQKKPEICRFYLSERGCTRETCVYYHSDWPCRHFHKNGTCSYGDSCKFSHAELTDETRHLVSVEFNSEHHLDNWRSSSNNDSAHSSEKKKIPSLLDLEIYPPGMEPKIPSPTFSSRGAYKRQRTSGQPGLLGAGPRDMQSGGSNSRSRQRQMGGNAKGYYSSSYGNDLFNMDDTTPPQSMQSPDNSQESRFQMHSEDDDDEDEESYQQEFGDDEEQSEMMTSDSGQLASVDEQNHQHDPYRRAFQPQEDEHGNQKNVASNSGQSFDTGVEEFDEKWYSSDEEGEKKTDITTQPQPVCSVANVILPINQVPQMTQTPLPTPLQTPLTSESILPLPPRMFAMMPPPLCGLMPRGMPPPREMMHLQNPMSQSMRPEMPNLRPELMQQRNMAPTSDINSQNMGLMMPRSMVSTDMMVPRNMMPPPLDIMGQGMMPPRGLMQPLDIMGKGMMPPRCMVPNQDLLGQNMMPPQMTSSSDMLGQGMMSPRGVLPPSTDRILPLGMMPQHGMVPPPDLMSQGLMSVKGLPPPSEMPPPCGLRPPVISQPDCRPQFDLAPQGIGPLPNFDFNQIMSIIRNSSLLPPTATAAPEFTLDSSLNHCRMMTTAVPNFNQPFDPRTSGNVCDPRLRQNEPYSDTGMTMVSTFLQPPESPDQEIEINGTGKKVNYVLRQITIDNHPGPPAGINIENLRNSADPRLRKYLNLSQANSKLRSDDDVEANDGAIAKKPTDPRLSKRGLETRKSEESEGNNDGNKKPPKPYSLPDIVLPVLPNLGQEKSTPRQTTEGNSSSRKALSDDSAHTKLSSSPGIKPTEKVPQSLVELPEALQERNFPVNAKLLRQPSVGTEPAVVAHTEKKVIDYRNDPRYKKKKSKSLTADTNATSMVEESREIMSPSITISQQGHSNNKPILDPQPCQSNSNKSQTPQFAPFEREFETPNDEAAAGDHIAKENISSDPRSERSDISVHTPVTFFEGVPVSDILADVEPAQELNLKDMFKTIDPTTSPFC